MENCQLLAEALIHLLLSMCVNRKENLPSLGDIALSKDTVTHNLFETIPKVINSNNSINNIECTLNSNSNACSREMMTTLSSHSPFLSSRSKSVDKVNDPFSTLLLSLNQLASQITHDPIPQNPLQVNANSSFQCPYVFNYECDGEKEDYQKTVSVLTSSLEILLKQVRLEMIQYFYHCDRALTRIFLHYIHFLLDKKWYVQAFFFSLSLIQYAVYSSKNG